MELRFDGQIVVVTGASGGIGSALATAFAGAGGSVALHCNSRRAEALSLAEKLTSDGHDAFVVQADLTKPGGADYVVDEVLGARGRLDIVVNNAGAMLARTPVADADAELVRRLMDVNFLSTFEMCRASIPALRRSGSGSIINVTSVAARTGGGGGAVLYASAKAAVATLTRGLALELARDGIRVNALEPGLIESTFHETVTSGEAFEGMAAATPMGRAGRSADCAGAALLMANNQASGFMTGATVTVSGGI
jgi:3-oxoacyl-[acyl-carrier protein] reductase